MTTTYKGFANSDFSQFLQFVGNYRKPTLEWVDNQTIQVVGTAEKPIYFVIGGKIRSVQKTLTMKRTVSGIGGIAQSENKLTAFYIYAVLDNGQVGLIGDLRPPTSGVRGYGAWTYLGSVFVDFTKDVMYQFKYSDGFIMYGNELEVEAHTGTAVTAYTLSYMSSVAEMAYGWLEADGATVNKVSKAMGLEEGGNNDMAQSVSVANIAVYQFGWIPIFTANTIYLKADDAANTARFGLMGWKENINAFP